MAIVDRRWSALPVPFSMEFPDRARKERYYDPDFYQMEVDLLWPRVWQMACRLEEIPQPARLRRVRDPRSVRHRGAHRGPGRAGVPEHLPPSWRPGGRGSGDVRDRVHLPLPWVVLRPGRQEHLRHPVQDLRRAQPPAGGPRPHTGAVRATWGGCAWINLDDDAPPLRECIEPFATILDAWKVESHASRVVVRLSAPGQLEARPRGVHGAVPRDRDPSPAGHPATHPAATGRGRRSTDPRRRRAPLPAHHERGHGRDGARQRRTRGRGPAGHGTARRSQTGHVDLGPGPQRRRRGLAPRARARIFPISTSSRTRGSTSRWATASRTTSSCPCTAAPPPTGSDRWDPRRP